MLRTVLSAAAFILSSAIAASAAAGSPAPDAACTAKSAKAAEINKIAQDPKAFAGKCVRLKGYWRDTGFYPTAAEAGQPDALGVIFLKLRRVGLYLTEADAARAPRGPRSANLYGTAGACAAQSDAEGYCKFVPDGAYVAVAGIELSQ